MSSENNELANVNKGSQELAPNDKHWSYDSGWRQEQDGSRWREKGEEDYQKSETPLDNGGVETRESYPSSLFPSFSFPSFLCICICVLFVFPFYVLLWF